MTTGLGRFSATACVALALSLGNCECDDGLASFPAGPGEGEGEGEGAAGDLCASANDCALGSFCNEFGVCAPSQVLPGADGGPGVPGVPPELEAERRRPASGLRYVYVPMEELDTVARIDSETLDIATIPVGDRPRELVTAAGQDLAVVINHGSDSVSVLRTMTDGTDEVVTLPTLPNLNRVVVGPLGEHAVVYFQLESADATDVGSFQDVAVVRLVEGEERAVNVSVGFRPRKVVFNDDGSEAYVHTDDGVSIVTLADAEDDYFAPTRALSGPAFGDDPLADVDPAEVVIARDGGYAYARFADGAFVRAVALTGGSFVDVPLAAVPTDLDLSADATLLTAVLRETSTLALLPIPAALDNAGAVEEIDCAPLTIGLTELTADGTGALVYTNAEPELALGVVDLDTASVDIVTVRKAISTVTLSPDDSFALVVHAKTPGDPNPQDDFDTQLQHRHGFSLVDLETRFAKLQLTDARPGAATFEPETGALFLVVASETDELRDVVRVDLGSFVAANITLSSHPTNIGVVPETARVYVSQEHNLGRISFIDAETDEVRTVTGFQLNSQITE